MPERSKKEGWPNAVSSCLIGSCTNSSFEDMAKAAHLTKQALDAGLKFKVPFYVTPGSVAVAKAIEAEGFTAIFEEAGGVVLAKACGPCIGQWKRKAPPGVKVSSGARTPSITSLHQTPTTSLTPSPPSLLQNTIITSYNRNFAKRNDGNPNTYAFVTSPELTTMYAFAGELAFNPYADELDLPDGKKFKFAMPKGAKALPRKFPGSEETFKPSLTDKAAAAAVKIAVDPASKRLELLEPFAAWDGNDYLECPVLIKALGKCTTDHISMAGPWLKFRGHLSNISDNCLIGAINAETEATNAVTCQLDGVVGKVPDVGRKYRDAGVKWVVVGDKNYGEGSSREHAALEPRHLGGVAILVRSFARIHETNLKKQGMLPLTFADPSDYDKITGNDKISILGLDGLKEGSNLTLRVSPKEGAPFEIVACHTFNPEQIEWFKAGSALNAMKAKMAEAPKKVEAFPVGA